MEIQEFLKRRWLRVGDGSSLRGMYGAVGGPTIKTIEAICQDPEATQERNTPTRDRLAVLLYFNDWKDLLGAWRKQDVSRGITFHVRPAVFDAAADAARRSGKTVDQWVTETILREATQVPPKKTADGTSAGR